MSKSLLCVRQEQCNTDINMLDPIVEDCLVSHLSLLKLFHCLKAIYVHSKIGTKSCENGAHSLNMEALHVAT